MSPEPHIGAFFWEVIAMAWLPVLFLAILVSIPFVLIEGAIKIRRKIMKWPKDTMVFIDGKPYIWFPKLRRYLPWDEWWRRLRKPRY